MKKINILFFIMAASPVFARLSPTAQQLMTGQCAAVQTTFDTQLAAKATPCEKLQYLLENEIQGCSIVTNSVLHYIFEKEHAGQTLNFDGCNLGYIHGATDNVLSHAVNLLGSNFTSASMQNVKLYNALLDRVTFTSADLTGAFFNYAQAYSSLIFEGSILVNTTFHYARLTNVNFKNANLTGAKFQHATLSKCHFSGANLTNTSFKHAQLKHLYCDPNNLPTVGNTTLPSGSVLVENTAANALKFCKSFTDAPTHG